MSSKDEERTAAVIVASTSAAQGRASDTTGPVILDWLTARGFVCEAPEVVEDGEPVGEALRGGILRGHDVILTTGGTGVSSSDTTPELTDPFLDIRLPGLIEELRRRGTGHAPAAALTRGCAGFAGGTFVMNLPGSPGGVRDGLAVLDPLLDHMLDQRRGLGAHVTDSR